VGTLEERADTQGKLNQVLALVELGLMQDTTNENTEAIDHFREQYGFSLRFFKATSQGEQMFDRNNLVVN